MISDSHVTAENFPAYDDPYEQLNAPRYRAVWCDEWRHSLCGQYETRAHVAVIDQYFYAGLEVSYSGDDSDTDYESIRHATMDEAIERAKKLESVWHRNLSREDGD